MNYIIGIGLVAILGALLCAGIFMLRTDSDTSAGPRPKSRAMMRALAWRVALSIGLFGLIWLAHSLGWIQPTGVPMR